MNLLNKHLIFAGVIGLISTQCYGQSTKENNTDKGIVNSEELRNGTNKEVKSVVIEPSSSTEKTNQKEVIQSLEHSPNTSHTYPLTVQSHRKENHASGNSPQQSSPEEHIASLELKIQSIESKIAVLKDDYDSNVDEIKEKENTLQELKAELQKIKN